MNRTLPLLLLVLLGCPGSPDVSVAVKPDDDGDCFTVYPDFDGDGFGDEAAGFGSCELGEGMVEVAGDCDDSNAAVFPDAPELCNGVDDDCDEAVDEGGGTAWLPDADADGYGAGEPVTACDAPEGHVEAGGDCDDADASSFPGGERICDGGDHDCDGAADAVVRFTTLDGTSTDLSAEIEAASPAIAELLIDEDGTLEVCGGDWPARVIFGGTALTVQGTGAESSALVGDGTAPMVQLPASGADLSVVDITLSGGSHGIQQAGVGSGAGTSSVSLDRAAVSDNVNYDGVGAGVVVAGVVNVNASSFTGNAVSSLFQALGSAVYVEDTLTSIDSLYESNEAESGGLDTADTRGGAVYASGDVTLMGDTFSANRAGLYGPGLTYAAAGGAVYAGGKLVGSGVTARANLLDATLTCGGDCTTSLRGGAFYAVGGAALTDSTLERQFLTLSVDACAGTECKASVQGGGVYAEGPLSVSNSNVSSNVLSLGAPGHTLSSEGAGAWGAGDVLCEAASGSYTGFWGNSATTGGALYMASAASLVSAACYWGSDEDESENTGGDIAGAYTIDIAGESSFVCAAGLCD